jgi:hypothetical protein
MAVSVAKLAANRRNAQKSTGPRTQEGKDKSKFNALDHGCRAKSLILPGEDSQALEARQAAWSASLPPGSDLEADYLHDAVVNSWQLDRARRTQAARLTAKILDHGVDREQVIKEDVSELGRRLFKDREGPLRFYPSPTVAGRDDFSRDPSTSFAGPGKDDPDPPALLILRLQATLRGCEWMLAQWARLKAILEKGQVWLSSDKLKAVRLLGHQPLDAIDEEEVALVFLASYKLNPYQSSWYWEIAMELADNDIKRFRKYAAARELESLMPEDAAKARDALLGLIERATEQLTMKVDAYRERARVEAAMVPDLLAFDDSPEGERLRRYELACGRAMSRSLDKMLKLATGERKKNEDGRMRTELLVHEPTGDYQNATNEPTAEWENATNEPKLAGENVTNEPTDAGENVTNEPIAELENATNEPTDAREKLTNEPTARGAAHLLQPAKRDEPATQRTTDNGQLTNEDREWRRALRTEETRQLNEQNRKAVELAMAARRDRLRERRKRNGKSGDRISAKDRTRERKKNEERRMRMGKLANEATGIAKT